MIVHIEAKQLREAHAACCKQLEAEPENKLLEQTIQTLFKAIGKGRPKNKSLPQEGPLAGRYKSTDLVEQPVPMK